MSTRTTSALLLAPALLALWLVPAAAQTVFDRMLIAGDRQVVKGKDHRSRPFAPSSDGKPLWIVMHLFGQGKMPAEVRAWVDNAQGLWFYRCRIVVALIGMALLLGGVIWWRLLRTP